MLKLSTILLLVLCMTSVALGATGRDLKGKVKGNGKGKSASITGNLDLTATSDARGEGADAGAFAIGGFTGQSRDGAVTITVKGDAKAFAAVTSELTTFFREVLNKKFFNSRCDLKNPKCCEKNTVRSLLDVELSAAATAYAKAVAAVLIEVRVEGKGKACAGVDVSAEAVATATAQIIARALVAAKIGSSFQQTIVEVNEIVTVHAHALASLWAGACAASNSQAAIQAMTKSEAFASAVIDVAIWAGAIAGCQEATGQKVEPTVTVNDGTKAGADAVGVADGNAVVGLEGFSDSSTGFVLPW